MRVLCVYLVISNNKKVKIIVLNYSEKNTTPRTTKNII